VWCAHAVTARLPMCAALPGFERTHVGIVSGGVGDVWEGCSVATPKRALFLTLPNESSPGRCGVDCFMICVLLVCGPCLAPNWQDVVICLGDAELWL